MERRASLPGLYSLEDACGDGQTPVAPFCEMTHASTAEPAIEFDHASFRLNGRPLLQDLVLSVRQGETLVLLGRGESVWNSEGLFTGWVDVGLSATGAQERTPNCRVGSDPLAARHRIRHSGRRSLSPLHR